MSLTLFRRCALFITGGVSLTYAAVKSLKAGDEKEELQLKINSWEVPVAPKLKSLIDEVQRDLNFHDKIKIIPYVTKHSDPSNSFDSFRSTLFLGLPQHFMYDSESENFNVVIDGRELTTETPEYEEMKRSLCLSEEAKKFAIAHEICESQHTIFLPYCILPILCIIHSNFFSYVDEKFSKIKNPRHSLRMQIMSYALAPIMYLVYHDALSIYKEYNSTVRAGQLGKSYIQGGLEYYKKRMTKYKISKALNIDSPYKEDGDIMTKIRKKHFPLHKRITCLEQINEGKELSAISFVLTR